MPAKLFDGLVTAAVVRKVRAFDAAPELRERSRGQASASPGRLYRQVALQDLRVLAKLFDGLATADAVREVRAIDAAPELREQDRGRAFASPGKLYREVALQDLRVLAKLFGGARVLDLALLHDVAAVAQAQHEREVLLREDD